MNLEYNGHGFWLLRSQILSIRVISLEHMDSESLNISARVKLLVTKVMSLENKTYEFREQGPGS